MEANKPIRKTLRPCPDESVNWDSTENLYIEGDNLEVLIQRERQLFYKGIKVLSLFFIDEVANYREYDAAGQPVNGKYATMFEKEYEDIVSTLQLSIGEDDYIKYLNSIKASKTHAG